MANRLGLHVSDGSHVVRKSLGVIWKTGRRSGVEQSRNRGVRAEVQIAAVRGTGRQTLYVHEGFPSLVAIRGESSHGLPRCDDTNDEALLPDIHHLLEPPPNPRQHTGRWIELVARFEICRHPYGGETIRHYLTAPFDPFVWVGY